jgi:hypothetical protein
MSTALLETEEVRAQSGADSETHPHAALAAVDQDPHPLVPVFIAGILAATLATMFVGFILAWLALQHSGVMAP